MLRIIRVWWVLIALLTASPGAFAQRCPNEQATSVSASFTVSPQFETCGIGVRIFGVGGSILGEKCHRWEAETPAHSVCSGAPLADHRCVPRALLDVRTRTCECGGLVLPFIETGFPVSCECSDWRVSGTVLDHTTIACAGVETPPHTRGGAGGQGGGGGQGGQGGSGAPEGGSTGPIGPPAPSAPHDPLAPFWPLGPGATGAPSSPLPPGGSAPLAPSSHGPIFGGWYLEPAS